MHIPSSGINLPIVLGNLEKEYIELALFMTHGNFAKAADLLGIKRTNFVAKRRKHGMLINPRRPNRAKVVSHE